MVLTLKVVPKSSVNVLSWYDRDKGILKLNLTAAPVEGKANKMAVEYLAKFFGVHKGEVRIQSGETSRIKQVVVEGQDEAIREKLSLLK